MLRKAFIVGNGAVLPGLIIPMSGIRNALTYAYVYVTNFMAISRAKESAKKKLSLRGVSR